jgi:CheY-like chemotaxis protein
MRSEQKTLLLVDDDPENVALLVRTFRNMYDLLTANSGDEAIGLLKTHQVDAIITDQRMPGMVGTKLLEQSIALQPDCVRIILSAFNDTTDFLDAINVCRVNHFLMKPVQPDRLREVVTTALNLSTKANRYTLRSHAFDMGAMSRYYEHEGLLKAEEFGRTFEDTIKIRALNLPDLDWLLFDQLLSVYRERIPLLHHYEALAVGLHVPFTSITNFLELMIQLKLLLPSVLNRTIFYRAPKPGRKIGEVMVELGLVTGQELARALAIQSTIEEKVGSRAVLGQVLRSVANLSTVELSQALGIQSGVPFTTLDGSAPEIFATAIRRPA